MPPTFRAVITSSALHVLRWTPRLLTRGPSSQKLSDLARDEVVVVDLTLDGDELVVTARQQQGVPAHVALRLVRWAHLVGCERIWLPDAMVDLDAATAPMGEVELECATCTVVIRDWSTDFWEMVRRHHCFPLTCNVCGAPLRQPELVHETTAEPATAEVDLAPRFDR